MEETSKNYRTAVVDGSDAGLTVADCLKKKGIDSIQLESPAEIGLDLAQILDKLGITKTVTIETESLKKLFLWSQFRKSISVHDIFGELRDR